MKLIAQENHYQQKKWEFAQMNQEIRLDELNKTEEKKAADELRKLKDLEKIRKAFDERDRNFRYEPTCIGNMKFKWATRMALSVAENFQLNVTVERNDRCGIIQFLGDSILSEVIWKDGNYLRQLLILLRWADGVCIGTKDDYGDTIIYIYLTYKLAREKLIHQNSKHQSTDVQSIGA